MNREEAFAIWAPAGYPWSPWAKAVLFSFMSNEISDVPPIPGPAWQVPLLQNSALVLDLAGARGVDVGMSLARSGYRPIPLFNACPYGFDSADTDGLLSVLASRPVANGVAPSVIDVAPMMRALAEQTSALKAIALPPSAPPAFLIDADRHNAAFTPDATWFDNRSIVRESDMPSANLLKDNGIQHVIVIRANPELQSDLQAVLLSWQEAGVAISRQPAMEPWAPVPFTVPQVSFLETWWVKLQHWLGYRPNGSAAFGRFVHGSSS